jgi:hypothetical protein
MSFLGTSDTYTIISGLGLSFFNSYNGIVLFSTFFGFLPNQPENPIGHLPSFLSS